MDLGSLVSQYAGLAGLAAAVAVIINILKHFGVVRDGTAQTWSTGLNIIGLGILFGFQAFAPEIDVAGVNATVGQVAEACMVIFGYMVQLFSSKLFHDLLRGVPLIGKSLTNAPF